MHVKPLSFLEDDDRPKTAEDMGKMSFQELTDYFEKHPHAQIQMVGMDLMQVTPKFFPILNVFFFPLFFLPGDFLSHIFFFALYQIHAYHLYQAKRRCKNKTVTNNRNSYPLSSNKTHYPQTWVQG